MNTTKTFTQTIASLILASGVLWTLTAAADSPNLQPAPVSATGHLFGIALTPYNANGLNIKCDDPNAPTHFLWPDDKTIPAAWPRFFPDHTLELTYTAVNGHPALTSLKLFSPISGGGKLTGIVRDKKAGPGGSYIEVKAAATPTMRFVPLWDMKTKGYQKEILDQIASANVGDTVEVSWVADPERVHLKGLTVVAKAPPGAGGAPAAVSPVAR